MKYSKEEIMEYVEINDIKFIRLAFCDIYGKQKNIAITATELERALTAGIAVNAASIAGFGGSICEDLVLHPDTSTLAVLPWRPEHGGVVRMFCSVSYMDGRPFEADSRTVLEKAVEDARTEGVDFTFGADMEFYLFLRDENGVSTKIPQDSAHYMDIAPEDKGENVRREVELAMERMGVMPESSHHEEGPGQNEITFSNASPLKAADDAVTFHAVVKTIAARNGLAADFSPKPLANQPGNSMHIKFLGEKEGEDILPQLVAGVLCHIKEITAFINTVEDSYNRFGTNTAPKYVSWGVSNRPLLVKVQNNPAYDKGAELRSADPLCNPYLAYALIIRAGLDGLSKGMVLPEAADKYVAAEFKDNYETLPLTLEEAKKIARESDFIKSVLPAEIIEEYTK